MNPKHLLAACITSCLLYFGIFGFLVHHPLTLGANIGYLDQKRTYLSRLEGPKLVLLAGSNGRFSHRCETLEDQLGLPCANMSVQAGISLDYQLARFEPYLEPGDIVYLPLEYKFYSGELQDMKGGVELPLIMAYDKKHLPALGLTRLTYALFYFDLKFLITGLGEMLLEAAGVQRRFSIETLTENGDESGHTPKKGKEYRAFVDAIAWHPPSSVDIDEHSQGAKSIADFLGIASERGVTVVGGLPTTFDDSPVPHDVVKRIAALYNSRGHKFVALENNSQYPRSYFYDTAAHLSEPYQIAHTTAIAALLRRELGEQIQPENPAATESSFDHQRNSATSGMATSSGPN